MMRIYAVIFFLGALLDNGDPLAKAKGYIAQEKYTLAINTLVYSHSPERFYFLGWCYYKTGDCISATGAFTHFINSTEASSTWRSMANRLIEECGSQSQRSLPVSKTPSKGQKYNPEEYINALRSSQQEDVREEERKISNSVRILIPRDRFNNLVTNEKSKGDDKNVSMSEKIIVDKDREGDSEDSPSKDILNNPQTVDRPSRSITKNNVILEVEGLTKADDIRLMKKNVITSQDDRHHYKILFAASSLKDQSYLSLADLGPITFEDAGNGMYLYYLGNYNDREEGLNAVAEIRTKGFPEAVLMEFDKGGLVQEHQPESIPEVITEITKPELPEPVVEEIIKKDVISYHILFRVLDNPYEEFPELKEVGPLYRETYDKAGNSRYLVGNTDDLEIARQLLKIVKKRGYPSSFIVEYINGELRGMVK